MSKHINDDVFLAKSSQEFYVIWNCAYVALIFHFPHVLMRTASSSISQIIPFWPLQSPCNNDSDESSILTLVSLI